MTAAGGCFVANLDVEHTWARRAGLRPRALSKTARSLVARVGLLCAVLAPEADTLWTIDPVDPACLRDVPGVPRPTLRSGPAPDEPSGQWGDPSAWRVGHRRWAFRHGDAWGTSLAGAAFVDSVDALVAHPTCLGPWVAKAPYAAAGRDRVRGQGADLRPPSRRRVERLLATYGEVLVEPWLERVADFGCVSDADGVHIHGLEVSQDGAFLAIGPLGSAALPAADAATLRAVTEHVGRDLAAAGYTGPFGIDAFHYRASVGDVQLRPLCEVNARHTFGHIARAMRPAAEAAWGTGTAWRLCVGGGSLEDNGVTERIVPLVGTEDGQRAQAWLERVHG